MSTDMLLIDRHYCIFTAAMVGDKPEFVINFRPTTAPIEYAATTPAAFQHWALFQELPQDIQEGVMELAKCWLVTKRLSGELPSEYRLDDA